MERLTEHSKCGQALFAKFANDYEFPIEAVAAVLNRLAEYEDTGLEPYHIPGVLADCHKLVEMCKELKDESSKLKCLLATAVNDLNKLAKNAAVKDRHDIFTTKKIGIDGVCGSISWDEWRHTDEAKELINNENELDSSY